MLKSKIPILATNVKILHNVNSIRSWHDDLRGVRIRHVFRNTVHITMSPGLARRQSTSTNDFHFHADVLHFHELSGKLFLEFVGHLIRYKQYRISPK